MLKPQVYVILVPAVVGLVYMILHEDLSKTGWILAGCLAFGAAMMFVVYKISEAKLKETEPSNKDKVDRSAFKVFQSETLSATCARLAEEQPKGYVAVAQYLRETVHTDSIAAIETVKASAIQHSLTRLLSGNTDPNSALAILELLNEVLANKQAKAALTADVDVLHTAVDAALHWVAILASNLIRVLHLPTDIMPLTGVQLTAGADVNSLSQAQAVAFAAGEGLNGRTEQLIALTNKALVCVGLLCSDDCPDAQTRLTDRGGAKVLLGVLAIAVAMCSTTTASTGIGASVGNSSRDAVGGGLSKEQRRKHSAGLSKWACWCLFNMSLDHPPAKSVLYHCQAIATAVDALKMHPDSAHVHRQGLALLFNLIAPDLYAKYSLAHARQSLLANGIVDVVEHAKVAFKKERDIVATCRAISNTMMVDFS